MSNIPDYSGHRQMADTEDLSRLSELIEKLEEAKREEATAVEALAEKKRQVTELEQHALPELMLALNTRKHETASGFSIALRETIRCSIPVANRPKCVQWLIDQGHGGLVKDTVSVSFNVNEHGDAMSLADRLREDHGHVTQDQKVEPSTLRAFIRTQLEQGVDFPMEMFGAFQQQIAVVRQKKQPQQF